LQGLLIFEGETEYFGGDDGAPVATTDTIQVVWPFALGASKIPRATTAIAYTAKRLRPVPRINWLGITISLM